ncbi:AmmeMemoRadiSam system protein B [Dactylosporangium roseum]|uniref:AmmeMemoRadiSam system protein B n=1 Tax=Dactylosporangium roseum TaxID=47989 RepID=A0ABY5Z5G1_9ACTN|nr:AmmeMemoRadiSam system protein B [Dactylosporangium roseum]UWZ36712.1 AmmeMemoRadiSam system protein B [Dactylosporangium roseum]
MRRPAVAGTFYPASPSHLQAMVDDLLSSVPEPSADGADAYIVPHAGYRWSGRTAAHVYRRLMVRRPARVAVLGPAHRVPLRGAAVPTDGRWATPLGPIAIDTDGARELVARRLAIADDRPHAPEHSIEVQAPFLQQLPDVRLLPICIGQSTAEHIATVVAAVSRPDTVVLCSTDLSHYLTEEEARLRDVATVAAIVALSPTRIGSRDACGRHALRGLLAWAASNRRSATVLHLATSADEGGPRGRVVGYLAASLTV